MSGTARRNIVHKSRHRDNTATALKVRQQNRFYVLLRNCNSAVYKSLSDFKLRFLLHCPERIPRFFKPFVGTIFQLLIYFNQKYFSD